MADEKQCVWVDCDPGHDDFFAILYAAYHPKLQLIGLSTCGGNQPLHEVTKNAVSTLEIIKMPHIPCCKGQAHGLMSRINEDAIIGHGEGYEGLNTWQYVPNSSILPRTEHWLEYMAKTIMNAPTRVILVAIGPLTNIALLLFTFPEVMRNIDHISIMGGAIQGGNTSGVAEYNIIADPEAANIVFKYGSSHSSMSQLPSDELDKIPTHALTVPIRLTTLDITHTVLVTKDVLSQLQNKCEEHLLGPGSVEKKCKFYKVAHDILMYYQDSYCNDYGFVEGPPLHDPVAVHFSLHPEDFIYKHYRVDVECAYSHSRGQTVVDLWSQTGKKPNAFIATKLQVPRFWDVMGQIFQTASQQTIFNQMTEEHKE